MRLVHWTSMGLVCVLYFGLFDASGALAARRSKKAGKSAVTEVSSIKGMMFAARSFVATWSRKRIGVKLWYACHVKSACGGVLTLRLRDLRGRVWGKTLRRVKMSAVYAPVSFRWKRRISLRRAELLVLEYAYRLKNKQTTKRVSLASLLDVPTLSLLGKKTWYVGSPATFRILVKRRRTGRAYKGARIRVSLREKKRKRVWQRQACQIDETGSCSLSFQVPEALIGKRATLRFTLLSDMGKYTKMQEISISHRARVLLTSDKPIYQPGQRIYMRALAMRVPAGRALAKAKVTFSVKDGRGNVVFLKSVKTNDFGIAHTTFALARQVNQGAYVLYARLALPSGGVRTSQKKVKVYRYQLPTFRTKISLKRPYALIGEALDVGLAVRYLFGRPVVGATVKAHAWLQGKGTHRIFTYNGKTNAKGGVRFRMKVRHGQVLRGQRSWKIDHTALYIGASVTAPGGEVRWVQRRLPLSVYPILIQIVPEFSPAMPGVRQAFHVITTRPDGRPVSAKVKITPVGAKQSHSCRTDGYGLGRVWLKPSSVPHATRGWSLQVTASNAQGQQGRLLKMLSLRKKAQIPVLVGRTAHALYREGEVIALSIRATDRRRLSASQSSYGYVDIFRGGQLFGSYAVRLQKDGSGVLSLRLPKGSHGLLRYVVYPIGRRQRLSRASLARGPMWHVGWVYVQRAGELKVQMTMDRAMYRPRQRAKLSFQVRDQNGKAKESALGIQIVDEAVAVLAGSPGRKLRTYFRLKHAVLASKVRLPGFGVDALVFGEHKGKDWVRRRAAAAVMLAAATPKVSYDVAVNTEAAYMRRIGKRAAKRARAFVFNIAQRLARLSYRRLRRSAAGYGCSGYFPEVDTGAFLRKGWLKDSDLLDPWGRRIAFSVERIGKSRRFRVHVTSFGLNGRDEQYNKSGDDIQIKIRFRLKRGKRSRPCRVIRKQYASVRYGRGGWGYGGSGSGGFYRTGRMRRVLLGAGPRRRSWSPQSVRHYFPEMLFAHPSLITDRNGKASVTVRMADSITRWKMLTLASTKDGLFGVHRASIRVFQPFFLEAKAPSVLMRGDQITLPVVIHNHRDRADDVTVTLRKAPWFRLLVPAMKRIKIAPKEVKVVRFVLQVQKVGRHSFQVQANGTGVSDAVAKPVEVSPDGIPQADIKGGYIVNVMRQRVMIPTDIVPDSGELSLEVAPGPVAESLGGLDSMLREPHGCFEQTSSTTYPNVMILQHLSSQRVTKKRAAVAFRARRLVDKGYQRLLSFEVRGGGFSLYGRAPAEVGLTAYGLHEFVDMREVRHVDSGMLHRTVRYLMRQQLRDGSWKPRSSFSHRKSHNQIYRMRTTAYTAWALARSRKQSDAAVNAVVQRAIAYLGARLGNVSKDAYTLVLSGHLMASVQGRRSRKYLQSILKQLAGLVRKQSRGSSWPCIGSTMMGSRGQTAQSEVTALVASLLLRVKRMPLLTKQGVDYLVTNRAPRGGWGTTQATVLALQALLSAQKRSRASDARGALTVSWDGKPLKRLVLNRQNAHVFHRIDLGKFAQRGQSGFLSLRFRGRGNPTYQIRRRFYRLRRGKKNKSKHGHPKVHFKVAYPKKAIPGKWSRVVVTVASKSMAIAYQPLVKIGRPAGFVEEPGTFEKWVKQGKILRFERTARHIVLYLANLKPSGFHTFSYRIRAMFPHRVTPPLSSIYEYYQPEQVGYVQAPAILVE